MRCRKAVESRRRIQCRLLVGPVPHLEASVIHPLSRGGLFGICLELVPSFYLQGVFSSQKFSPPL